jgi:CRP/FNR family transcriptional regulator
MESRLIPDSDQNSGAQCKSCESCGLWRICFPGRVARETDPSTPGDDARSCALRIRRLRVARDTVLYRAGDRVGAFYMVRSGCIKEIDESVGARGAVVNFALPGEMLSLQSVGDEISLTTAVAVEPTFVCVVPWEDFNQLCAETPRVAAEFIRLIAQAGSVMRDLLTLIRDKEALERVSGFLLNVSGRLQHRGARGRDLRLGMNRDDIANYLGLRSETVSRCFTELARRQLIKVRAKRVQILSDSDLREVFQHA